MLTYVRHGSLEYRREGRAEMSLKLRQCGMQRMDVENNPRVAWGKARLDAGAVTVHATHVSFPGASGEVRV